MEIDIQADDCFDYDDVPDYIEVADLGWITQGLLNRWTSQYDRGCTTGWLERILKYLTN